MTRKYRIFIINTDYPDYINSIYNSNPNLKEKSFSEQYAYRMETLYGMADFYSKNLRKLGHEAIDVIANHEPIQKQWATENVTKFRKNSYFDISLINKIFKRQNWIFQILDEQIKQFRPDVVYNMAMETITSPFLKCIKTEYNIKLIVGQHAAPLTKSMNDLSGYDLILSSLPNFVQRFKEIGITSEYFKLGFETTILERLNKDHQKHHAVFIGGISGSHSKGTKILETLARNVQIDFWGYGVDFLPPESNIRPRHHGMIWGKEMYHVLHNSKISINRHIDIAENYANNMRLYETTGSGTLLITDYKDNLNEIFDIGKEVEIYHNEKDLIEKIRYYLENEEEREKIANAGQKRTLREHSYSNRMKELIEIIEKYM